MRFCYLQPYTLELKFSQRRSVQKTDLTYTVSERSRILQNQRLATISLTESFNSNGHNHSLLHTIGHCVAEIHSNRGADAAHVQIAVWGSWHLGHRGVLGIVLL